MVETVNIKELEDQQLTILFNYEWKHSCANIFLLNEVPEKIEPTERFQIMFILTAQLVLES